MLLYRFIDNVYVFYISVTKDSNGQLVILNSARTCFIFNNSVLMATQLKHFRLVYHSLICSPTR